jgi:hypothetical protein
MAGDLMKQNIDIELFSLAYNRRQFPMGKRILTFENLSNGKSNYEALFNSQTLSLLQSIDAKDKIANFAFTPYNQ